jgi:hypothetical protein
MAEQRALAPFSTGSLVMGRLADSPEKGVLVDVVWMAGAVPSDAPISRGYLPSAQVDMQHSTVVVAVCSCVCESFQAFRPSSGCRYDGDPVSSGWCTAGFRVYQVSSQPYFWWLVGLRRASKSIRTAGGGGDEKRSSQVCRRPVSGRPQRKYGGKKI